MPFVYVSDDDFCYLELYSESFHVSVESVIHRRIEILKSATSFGVKVALNLGADHDSKIEALADVSSSFSLGSCISSSELLIAERGCCDS